MGAVITKVVFWPWESLQVLYVTQSGWNLVQIDRPFLIKMLMFESVF